MVLIIENYKLKTVAFYIFVATVISFDLKGSENENEWNCHCCCCPDEGENKEKEIEEESEENKGNKENKEENKENKEEKGEENKEEGENKKYIENFKQRYEAIIEDERFFNSKKIFKSKKCKINETKKRRLFIADEKDFCTEIKFSSDEKRINDLFSYKKTLFGNKLSLTELFLISYCPKENDKNDFVIHEMEMTDNLIIKDVFDQFKGASTWSNEKNSLILFIKSKRNKDLFFTYSRSDGEYVYVFFEGNK